MSTSTTLSTTIRRLGPEDAAAVQALREEALRAHPEAYHSTVEEGIGSLEERKLRIGRQHYFGAFAGATLVGLVVLATDARPGGKLRHKGELWSVYVAPSHRGDGTARSLLDAAIGEARDAKLEALCLSVAAANMGVVRFYERLGFRQYGLEPRAMKFPDGRYGDDVLMQLDL